METSELSEPLTPDYIAVVTGVNHSINQKGILEAQLCAEQDPVAKADLLRNIGDFMYFELVEQCLRGSDRWTLLEQANQIARIMYRLGRNNGIVTEFSKQSNHKGLARHILGRALSDTASVEALRKGQN